MLLWPFLKARLGWDVEAAPPSSYLVGERIDVSPSMYAASRRTVLLFLRPNCPACERSKLTVGALVAETKALPAVNVVMLVPAGGPDDVAILARSIGIDAAHVATVESDTLRIRFVPSVVVVDSDGSILLVRQGVFTEADRRDVLQLLAAGDSGPPVSAPTGR